MTWRPYISRFVLLTSMRLKHFPHMSVECIAHFPHMSVECIPMDKEVGDLAPIYFKVCIINFYETEAFSSHVSRVYSYGQGGG